MYVHCLYGGVVFARIRSIFIGCDWLNLCRRTPYARLCCYSFYFPCLDDELIRSLSATVYLFSIIDQSIIKTDNFHFADDPFKKPAIDTIRKYPLRIICSQKLYNNNEPILRLSFTHDRFIMVSSRHSRWSNSNPNNSNFTDMTHENCSFLILEPSLSDKVSTRPGTDNPSSRCFLIPLFASARKHQRNWRAHDTTIVLC